MQDVGAFLGMIAFTAVATRIGRTPAFFMGFLACLGVTIYVFNNLHAFPWLLTTDDRRTADFASGYWLNFVKTGDPNGPGLPAWPSYRRADNPFMAIDAAPEVRTDSERSRHQFLADVARNKTGLH